MKLEDVGFTMREANTPEKMARLKRIPPRIFVPHRKNGQLYYVYADPDHCKCAFVGNQAAMQAYRDMVSLQRRLQQPDKSAPAAPMSLGKCSRKWTTRAAPISTTFSIPDIDQRWHGTAPDWRGLCLIVACAGRGMRVFSPRWPCNRALQRSQTESPEHPVVVRAPAIPDRPDQAVALRRRRLRHPVVALDDPVEQPRQRLRPARRMRRRQGARPRRRHRDRRLRRVQHRHRRQAHRSARSARPAAGSSAWSACSRTSFRARSISRRAVPRRRDSGGDRRLPRQRLHLDAARACRPTCRRRSISASRSIAGEAEGRMAELLRDIDSGAAKPIYNYLDDMPEMAAATFPILPRRRGDARRRANTRASMPAAAARSSAASAPSSTCRAASRAIAPPTTSRRSSAPTPRRASPASSSPTTISPATRTGSRSSTA